MDLLIYCCLFLPALVGAGILFFKIPASLAWWLAVGSAFLAVLLNLAIAFHVADQHMGIAGLESNILRWSETWAFDFSFRFHALSLCFLLSSSLVFFLTILLARPELEREESKNAAILFLMSSIMAALAAKTIFLFTFFAFASLLPVMTLIGLDANTQRTSTLKHYATTMFVADLLFFLVALYLHPKFHGDIRAWFTIVGSNYEVTANVLGFFLLSIACIIRLGLFPFHFFLFELFNAKKIDVLIPVITVVGMGFYAFFNFVPQFFPQEFKAYAPVLGVLAIASAFFSALSLLRAETTRQRAMHLQLFMSSLVFLGLASLNRIGWSGSWMMATFEIFVIALLLQLTSISERRTNLLKIRELGHAPFYAISSTYASISAYGLPISFGFYGMLFVFWGVCNGMPKSFVVSLFCIPLLVLSSIKMIFFKIRGISGETKEDGKSFQDLDKIEFLSMIPLFLLLVVIGLFPDLLLKFVTVAVDSSLGILSGAGL